MIGPIYTERKRTWKQNISLIFVAAQYEHSTGRFYLHSNILLLKMNIKLYSLQIHLEAVSHSL